MKQNITFEQFNEISKDQQATLSMWITARYGPGASVYINIGRMIEFIGEKGLLDAPFQEYLSFRGRSDLVDILWDSVKEVLNAEEEEKLDR